MCDEVIKLVMQKLGIEVQPFKLKRRVKISLRDIAKPKPGKALHVEGIDVDGTPYSLFSKVVAVINKEAQTSEKEPFIVIKKLIFISLSCPRLYQLKQLLRCIFKHTILNHQQILLYQ